MALTEAFKHDLVSRGIPAEHVAVVLNGFDFARYTPQPRDMSLTQQLGLEGCFVVGYIGTHGMAHALDRVLDAAALLRDTPAIRFLFVGAGAVRDALIAQAAHQQLANVIFVPAQPKTRMPAYWSICDLALVPLKNTPLFTTVLPSKIFEAMGMGRALVLAAPEGEASQIIRATGAGVIVPPECPTAMARDAREQRGSGMQRDDVLKILADHRDELRQQFGVKSLALFGSVARNEATETSDVDLLVAFARPVGLFGLYALQDYLGQLLGCTVDVGTLDGLKPRIRARVLAESIEVS